MMKLAKKSSTFILLLFVGTMFLGLLQMATISNTDHGCPSMGHEDSICLMSFAEYMETWKSIYLATTANFGIDLLLYSLFTILVATAPNLLKKTLFLYKLPKYNGRRKSTFLTPYFLQVLFSNGILNPKLF